MRTPGKIIGPRLLRLAAAHRLPLWLSAFVGGVMLAQPGLRSASAILLAAAGVVALVGSLHGRRRLLGWAILAAALATGFLRQSSHELDLERSRALLSHADGPARLLARVTECPENFPDRATLALETEAIFDHGGWQPLAALLRLSLPERVTGLGRGDRLVALVTIDRPRSYHNPGAFDFRAYLARRGIGATGFCRSARLLARVQGPGSILGAIDRLREKYIARLTASGTNGSALLAALLAGDRGALTPEVQEAFNRTGLAHLLAVSGLHLGLVAATCYLAWLWLLKRAPALIVRFPAQRAAALCSLPPVIAYALLTGMRLPTQRALVMVVTFLTAVALDREREVWSALALSAAVSLFVWPEALFESSFQLSYLAVAAMLYLLPRMTAIARGRRSAADRELDRLEAALGGGQRSPAVRLGRYLVGLLAMTAAAMWGVLPLTVGLFHRANPLALAYNLFAVPLAGEVIIPLGLLASLLGLVAPSAGAEAILFVSWLGEMLVDVMLFCAANLPGGRLLPSLTAAGAAAWYLAGTIGIEGLLGLRRRVWSWELFGPAWKRWMLYETESEPPTRGRRRFVVVLALAVLLFLLPLRELAWPPCRLPAGATTLAAIDVGSGQALLLRTRDGRIALVDGGGTYEGDWDIGEKVVAPCLLALGIVHLDAVALTHPHPDHAGGLGFILRNFEVGEFWLGPGRQPLADELRQLAVARGIVVRELSAGVAPFGFGAAAIRVLHPPPGRGWREQNLNNQSLTLAVNGGDLTLLLPGDIERETETLLLTKYGPSSAAPALSARVMVVPHHGSKTSSSLEFLAAVNPEAALCSAGGHERFGLPAPAVLDRYHGRGIAVRETDRAGFVGVTVDRGRLRFLDADGR